MNPSTKVILLVLSVLPILNCVSASGFSVLVDIFHPVNDTWNYSGSLLLNYTLLDNGSLQIDVLDLEGGLLTTLFYDFKKVEYSAGQVSCTTYYLGKDFETRVCGNNEYNTTYYYADNELVGKKNTTGTYHYHNDHLGGTHVVTDSDGDVIERTRYYPFGKELTSTEADYVHAKLFYDKFFEVVLR